MTWTPEKRRRASERWTPERRQRRSIMAKALWDALTPEQREARMHKGREAYYAKYPDRRPAMTDDDMTRTIRAEQLAYWSGAATMFVQDLSDLDAEFRDGLQPFTYIPPASDDWREWEGVALWAAIHQRYNWCIARQAALESGKGPYYCKDHEPRIEGGRAQLCLRCSWDAYLEGEAMREARGMRDSLARQRQAVSA